jgi:hypothetical protein
MPGQGAAIQSRPAPGQGHDRDEEDVYQGNKRAPGQHSPVLASCGVRVIRVDDRHQREHDDADLAHPVTRACRIYPHICPGKMVITYAKSKPEADVTAGITR